MLNGRVKYSKKEAYGRNLTSFLCEETGKFTESCKIKDRISQHNRKQADKEAHHHKCVGTALLHSPVD